jgi:hypothetical protein
MLTDAAYSVANLKYDVDKCPECCSRGIIGVKYVKNVA